MGIKDVHATICSYQISPATPLSLAELAGLLPLVSDQSKHYDPFSKQCYWYARAVYESIKRRYQILDEELGEAYSSRGKHVKLPIPCSVSADVLEKIATTWLTRIEQISEVKTMSEVRPKLEHRLDDDYADLNGKILDSHRIAEEEKNAAKGRARTAEETLEATKREAEERLEATKREAEERLEATQREAEEALAVIMQKLAEAEARAGSTNARRVAED